MRKFLFLLSLCLAPIGLHAGSAPVKEVVIETKDRFPFEVMVEQAHMFNIDNNINKYYFLTNMVSLGWEPFSEFRWGWLRMRTQFMGTFYAAAILHGPENYYLGGGPQIRLIFPIADSRWSFFATFGAGAGVADADEAAKYNRGLGQDFTFILLANGGFRYSITNRWSAWAGFMWHHLSNANLSEPDKQNVGPDEIGVMFGGGYAF